MTEAASAKVKEFLQDDENRGKSLRIYVESGGCSGYQYGLAFDEVQEDDTRLELNGVSVVVDPKTADLVKGSNIDFVDSPQASGFKITNPTATGSCGCGQSFQA